MAGRLPAQPLQRWKLVLSCVWIICAVQGALSHFGSVTIPELNNWSEVKSTQAILIRQYLETKDPKLLSENPIANTFPEVLQTMLDDPSIVDILPTALRPALGSSRTASENAFFNRSYFEMGGDPTPGSQRYWSSFGPEGNAHQGQIELKFPGAKRSRLLEFFVAGAPHLEGNSLQIQFKDGAIKDLAPHHGSNAKWESVLVRVPPGAFTLVAKDESAQQCWQFPIPAKSASFHTILKSCWEYLRPPMERLPWKAFSHWRWPCGPSPWHGSLRAR